MLSKNKTTSRGINNPEYMLSKNKTTSRGINNPEYFEKKSKVGNNNKYLTILSNSNYSHLSAPKYVNLNRTGNPIPDLTRGYNALTPPSKNSIYGIIPTMPLTQDKKDEIAFNKLKTKEEQNEFIRAIQERDNPSPKVTNTTDIYGEAYKVVYPLAEYKNLHGTGVDEGKGNVFPVATSKDGTYMTAEEMKRKPSDAGYLPGKNTGPDYMTINNMKRLSRQQKVFSPPLTEEEKQAKNKEFENIMNQIANGTFGKELNNNKRTRLTPRQGTQKRRGPFKPVSKGISALPNLNTNNSRNIVSEYEAEKKNLQRPPSQEELKLKEKEAKVEELKLKAKAAAKKRLEDAEKNKEAKRIEAERIEALKASVLQSRREKKVSTQSTKRTRKAVSKEKRAERKAELKKTLSLEAEKVEKLKQALNNFDRRVAAAQLNVNMRAASNSSLKSLTDAAVANAKKRKEFQESLDAASNKYKEISELAKKQLMENRIEDAINSIDGIQLPNVPKSEEEQVKEAKIEELLKERLLITASEKLNKPRESFTSNEVKELLAERNEFIKNRQPRKLEKSIERVKSQTLKKQEGNSDAREKLRKRIAAENLADREYMSEKLLKRIAKDNREAEQFGFNQPVKETEPQKEEIFGFNNENYALNE